MELNNKKVLVAISGGVDSAVCASYLKNHGYDVECAIMLLADNTDVDGARLICNFLNLPLHIFDMRNEFKKHVTEPFCREYLDNKTPNPCIFCNKKLKFGVFYEKAKELGFEYIATGHYAKIVNESGRFLLKKSLCKEKDQSYMLYSLSKELLSHILFPLGNFSSKEDVRKYAEELNLPIAHKADSQDICFIPDGDYAKYILENTENKPECGNFITRGKTVLGKHKGLIHYTVGQRRGLGIALGQRAFVVEKNAFDNTVVIGEESELYRGSLTCTDVNFIVPTSLPITVEAVTRYRKAPASARIEKNSEGNIVCTFEHPQKFISSGQSVVFYDSDSVLGGGIIC